MPRREQQKNSAFTNYGLLVDELVHQHEQMGEGSLARLCMELAYLSEEVRGSLGVDKSNDVDKQNLQDALNLLQTGNNDGSYFSSVGYRFFHGRRYGHIREFVTTLADNAYEAAYRINAIREARKSLGEEGVAALSVLGELNYDFLSNRINAADSAPILNLLSKPDSLNTEAALPAAIQTVMGLFGEGNNIDAERFNSAMAIANEIVDWVARTVVLRLQAVRGLQANAREMAIREEAARLRLIQAANEYAVEHKNAVKLLVALLLGNEAPEWGGLNHTADEEVNGVRVGVIDLYHLSDEEFNNALIEAQNLVNGIKEEREEHEAGPTAEHPELAAGSARPLLITVHSPSLAAKVPVRHTAETPSQYSVVVGAIPQVFGPGEGEGSLADVIYYRGIIEQFIPVAGAERADTDGHASLPVEKQAQVAALKLQVNSEPVPGDASVAHLASHIPDQLEIIRNECKNKTLEYIKNNIANDDSELKKAFNTLNGLVDVLKPGTKVQFLLENTPADAMRTFHKHGKRANILSIAPHETVMQAVFYTSKYELRNFELGEGFASELKMPMSPNGEQDIQQIRTCKNMAEAWFCIVTAYTALQEDKRPNAKQQLELQHKLFHLAYTRATEKIKATPAHMLTPPRLALIRILTHWHALYTANQTLLDGNRIPMPEFTELFKADVGRAVFPGGNVPSSARDIYECLIDRVKVQFMADATTGEMHQLNVSETDAKNVTETTLASVQAKTFEESNTDAIDKVTARQRYHI